MSYDIFKRLYNDYSIPTNTIKEMIGRSNYNKFFKRAMKEGSIHKRPSNLRFESSFTNYYTPFKYYHFDKKRGMYRVRKVINGDYNCYGFYETEDEASRVVEICKKCGWDKNKVEEELVKVGL